MHIVFGTRGVQHVVDMWHTQMQGCWLPWTRRNLNVCLCGRTIKEHESEDCPCKDFQPRAETQNIQVALRPVQFWEVVFPKEHLNIMLNTLGVKPKGISEPAGLNKYAFLLRKGMGLKPVPDVIPATDKFPVPIQHMHIFPIGIKEDITEDCDFGKEGRYNQERL